MKCTFLFLVLVAGIVAHSPLDRIVARAQSEVASSRNQNRSVSQTVRLTTSVVSQQYCTQVVDPNTRYPELRLSVNLQVRNVSNETLIIPRYGAATYGVVLSRSLRDAQAQHYAYDSYSVLGKFQLADPDFPEVAPTDEFFILLQPDKTYDYEYSQPIDISLTDLGNPKWHLRPGNYYLQIRIQTWSWKTEKAKQLQQRWAKYGDFWYYDVKSEPMLLRIEKPNSITAMCQ